MKETFVCLCSQDIPLRVHWHGLRRDGDTECESQILALHQYYDSLGLPHAYSVKKISSQNVWPRINSNEWMNEWINELFNQLKPLEARFHSLKLREAQFHAVFFLRRQPRNFSNITLVAHRKEHFQVFLAIFLVAQISPKRGVLVHKNSLASCQRCLHSVEPRALTCPFKHSDLIAWSLLSWHPTLKYLWGRLCF